MRKILLSTLILTSLITLFAFTNLQKWKIKDTYSIKFSSKDASGVFKTFSGDIDFDTDDLAKSKFDFKIDVASINTGNALQNKHAKSDNWFDAANYPTINFTSNKFEKTDGGYKTTGTLEMHGVKKDITIPFTFKNNEFSADFTVNRLDYKIGKADKVANTIKIEATIPVAKK